MPISQDCQYQLNPYYAEYENAHKGLQARIRAQAKNDYETICKYRSVIIDKINAGEFEEIGGSALGWSWWRQKVLRDFYIGENRVAVFDNGVALNDRKMYEPHPVLVFN